MIAIITVVQDLIWNISLQEHKLCVLVYVAPPIVVHCNYVCCVAEYVLQTAAYTKIIRFGK